MSNNNLHNVLETDLLNIKIYMKKLFNESEEENITNDKNNNEVIDTQEESQIIKVADKMLMTVPKNMDLAFFNSKIRLILVYIICIIVIVCSSIYCLNIYNQDEDVLELTESMQSYIVEKSSTLEESNKEEVNYLVNFKELNNINSDTVGWLKVDGLDISMPIVQTNNNYYYLKHSFDKSNNLSGWAFMDYRNKLDDQDKNTVIYGHNRKDNIIFSSLINILSPKWYEKSDNKYITFIKENGKEEYYEIFSVYQIEAEDYYIKTDFNSNDEYSIFFETLKRRSIKNYNINCNQDSKIMTLSTCGQNIKFRVVLHAQKIV